MKRLLILAVLLTSLTPAAPFADPMEEMREGWDRQSPEEIERARKEIEALFTGDDEPVYATAAEENRVLAQYAFLDPARVVPTDLLTKTITYFDANKAKFPNQDYIVVVDFKPRSDKHRLFVIDMKTGAVEKYHTTHGTYSDENKDGIAESFGNVEGSGKSSLGYVRTAEVYWGKFRRSIRLDGLSRTNSNIRSRAIVLHGWDGVKEADVIQGWSWGCITLDWSIKDSVIDKVKEGALMYVGVSTNANK